MNAFVTVIVTVSVILLINTLLRRSGRDVDSAALREEAKQRWAEEPSLPSEDGRDQLMPPPEPDEKTKDKVTRSPTNAADQSRCPACGEIITAYDERCPSCDIAFVADGSQKWTLGAVGPADGIFRPPTEFSE